MELAMIAGNTRHQSSVALILIDVINRFEFPNGDRILENALPTAEKLAMHSAFFQTPLEILWRYLGASSLILCGLATHSCVVCTAHDANMRDFGLYVPSDCCAARTRREHRQAIEHIKDMADARVMASTSLRIADLKRERRTKK